MIKIGQYPSLADLAGIELQRYKQILGTERMTELHRAQGLAAHGVGVGSFVYLRRVFESLLDECRQQKAEDGSDIANYEHLRVDERINALSDVLPPFLVQNSTIYQILSTGLHELDENTCLRYFPVVRDGIILMLEQDFRNREHKRIEDQARADIQQITNAVRLSKSRTSKKR